MAKHAFFMKYETQKHRQLSERIKFQGEINVLFSCTHWVTRSIIVCFVFCTYCRATCYLSKTLRNLFFPNSPPINLFFFLPASFKYFRSSRKSRKQHFWGNFQNTHVNVRRIRTPFFKAQRRMFLKCSHPTLYVLVEYVLLRQKLP